MVWKWKCYHVNIAIVILAEHANVIVTVGVGVIKK